mmetsp:Transcript_16671/g.29908  ORF Transcript_16671/g.29908 Transcript_16671/m.29908 type:complete len:213 (+) Transcript_16671:630-1268(+)
MCNNYGCRLLKTLISQLNYHGGAFPEFHNSQNKFKYFTRLKMNIISMKSNLYIIKNPKNSVITRNNDKSFFFVNKTRQFFTEILKESRKHNIFSKSKSIAYFKIKSRYSFFIKLQTNSCDPMRINQSMDQFKKNSYNSSKLKKLQPVIWSFKKSPKLRIPKAISNWKNPRGYSIPLTKRSQLNNSDLIKKNINFKFISINNIFDLLEKKKNI